MSMDSTEYNEEMDEVKEMYAVDVNTTTPYPSNSVTNRICCLNWLPLRPQLRQGSEIWMNHIEITPASVDMDNHKNYVVAIVYDRQPNVEIVRSLGIAPAAPSDLGWPNPATFPTWKDIFDVETYHEIVYGPDTLQAQAFMPNRKNQDRFEILYLKHFMGYQQWYYIAPTPMSEPCLSYHKIMVDRPTVYQDIKNIYDPPDNYVYGRITTGALYMCVLGAQGTTESPDQRSWTRLFYEDA